MANYMKTFRETHPEYYEKEKIKNGERIKEKSEKDPDFRQKIIDINKNLYHTDPIFRQCIIENAKLRNKRLREQKQ